MRDPATGKFQKGHNGLSLRDPKTGRFAKSIRVKPGDPLPYPPSKFASEIEPLQWPIHDPQVANELAEQEGSHFPGKIYPKPRPSLWQRIKRFFGVGK